MARSDIGSKWCHIPFWRKIGLVSKKRKETRIIEEFLSSCRVNRPISAIFPRKISLIVSHQKAFNMVPPASRLRLKTFPDALIGPSTPMIVRAHEPSTFKGAVEKVCRIPCR